MIRRGDHQAAGKGLPWPDQAQGLLLQVAIGPDAGIPAALSAWRERVDLDAEIDGGSYRLLPVVYARAQAAGVDMPVLGLLKGVYRRHWCEMQTLLHATRPALAALHAAGIRTLAVKGLPLALGYYRNPACRPMSDLDLVVARSDLPRALHALQAAGWTYAGAPLAAPASAHPATALRSPAGVDDIDLHWHCLHDTPYAAADDWFWRDAQALDAGGTPLLQPRPTALLAHVLLHGIRSNPEPPIRWIADAGMIIRNAGIDWDDLVEFSRRHRLARRMSMGLDLLARDFAIAIPTRALAGLRRRGTSPIEYIENLNYLGGAHADRSYPRMLGLVAHLRVHRAAGRWRLLREVPVYFAARWNLSSLRQLPGEFARRLARRLLPFPGSNA